MIKDERIHDDYRNFITAVENLLTRYKQLEENQLWSEATIEGLKNDFIQKSKIKEKIEARESSIADIKDNFVINEGMTIEINRLETEIDVLQELLKGK